MPAGGLTQDNTGEIPDPGTCDAREDRNARTRPCLQMKTVPNPDNAMKSAAI